MCDFGYLQAQRTRRHAAHQSSHPGFVVAIRKGKFRKYEADVTDMGCYLNVGQ